MSLFQELNFSQIKGRVLLIADVHGHFAKLQERLNELVYSHTDDCLVFLGDLIDRGPHSTKAGKYLGHARILGNHEQMLWNGVRPNSDHGMLHTFLRNGGHWVSDHPTEHVRALAARLIDAPVALEIRTPAGNRIGCVHAEIPTACWSTVKDVLSQLGRRDLEVMQRLAYDDTVDQQPVLMHLYGCLWGRDAIGRNPVRHTRGIDHTFHGHTPVRNILTRGNATWMDGHAYAGGPMNILDADEYLRQLKNQPLKQNV